MLNISSFQRCLVAIFSYLCTVIVVQADYGDGNPTGVAGHFNGNVATGCSYDPYTGNAMRNITDMAVPGAVGQYGLTFTRFWNSRLIVPGEHGWHGGWSYSHFWSIDPISFVLPQQSIHAYTVRFPDGRVAIFTMHSPNYWHVGGGVHEQLKVSQLPPDGSLMYLLLPDGGQVVFQVSDTITPGPPGEPPYSHDFTFKALRVIDPVGVKTNFVYTLDQLSEIREVGDNDVETGRWIKIIYLQDGSGNIDYIQGSHGRRVKYQYQPFAGVQVLADVIYWDYNYLYALTAHYSYVANAGEPLLKTADDPMYAGRMKKIRYHYSTTGDAPDTALPHGFIVSENNLDTNDLVSQVTIHDANTRVETRGDGATRTFSYNTDGRLVSWTDFNNVPMSRHYDGQSVLDGLTDGNGHLTSFTNEPQVGNVATVTPPAPGVDDVEITPGEPTNSVIQYTYENPLEPYYVHTVTNPRGYQTTYTHGEHNRLMQIDYPGTPSAHEELIYNHLGQVTRHRRTNGTYEHFQYDPQGNLQIAWNPIESATTPSASGPEAKTTFTYYGANNPACSGRVETVTDANGHATIFEYDPFDRGLVTKITYADQKYSASDYDNYGRVLWRENELRQRTNYEHDDYGRVTHVKTPLPDNQVADTQYFYEPSPGVSAKVRTAPLITTLMRPPASSPLPDPTIVTTYQYDNDLRLKQVTQYPAAGSFPTITTLYDYDNAGNLKTITDPRQNATIIDYDNQNRKWRVTSPWVTGSVAQTTQYITRMKYDAAGNVRRIIQPDATEKVVEYDAMNRVLVDHAPIDPSNAHERTVSYAYYPSGTIQSVTDANHNITSFSYNNRDLRQTIASPALDVPATFWVYDNVGNLLGRPTVGGARQLLTYDSRNRVTQMRWSNGIDSSDFGYDDAGRLTLAQNPNSTVVRRYDEGGRLALETQTFPVEPGAPIPPVQPVSVVSRNYAQGNFDIPLPLIGDGGIECRSGGDDGDYQIVATFATPVTVNSVKVNSGIAKLVGANLSGTQITIDLTNVSTAQRLTVKLAGLSDGTYTGDLIIPMRVLIGDANGDGVVDDGDSLEITDHADEPLNATIARYDVDANGVIDNNDRDVVKTYSGKGLPLVATGGVSYEYDPDGKLNHLYVTGRGYDVSYRYDGMGRLYFIQQNNSGDSYQYSYDDASHPTYRYNNVNNTWVHREFDEIGRVKEESLHANQTSDFSHLHYTYDPMNRLRFTYREEDGLTDSFGYDEVGELTSAQYGMYWNGNAWEVPASPYLYHFDPVGNRLSVEHGATSETYVPNHLNQYDYVNNYPVVNGSEHEMSQFADVNYEYVNDGRLARVTMGGDAYELGYDALGRRVSSKFNGQVTHFIYNGVRAIVEYSADRTPAANTVYGLGIDEIIARNTGGGQFPLQNRLGSTVAVTGGKGTVLEQYRYDAFGTPTIMDGEGNVREKGTQINNRFLFAGREWVPQFGFYDYRARAYHPGLGRFMSEDPLGLVAGDVNLFRYCGNDPINGTDPFGLLTWQFGAQFAGNIGPFSWAWGAGIAFDGLGNVAGYGSWFAAPSSLGASIDLTLGGMRSDAVSIGSLRGPFDEGTLTAGAEEAMTLNVFHGYDAEGREVTGSGLFFGAGAGAGWSWGKSGTSLSKSFNVSDIFGSSGAPPPGGTTWVDPNDCRPPECATTERVTVTGTYVENFASGVTYHDWDGSPKHYGTTGNLINGSAFTVSNWFPSLTSNGGGDWQNVGYFPSGGQPGEGFHPVPWYLE